MGKRNSNNTDEMNAMREQQALTQKKLDEVLFLLGGGGIGKVSGLVDIVNGLVNSLTTLVGEFAHAEKWRRDFKAAQADYEQRNQQRRLISEQREHEAILKDKEIRALKRSNKIKNWIAFGAVAFTVIKAIFDYFNK